MSPRCCSVAALYCLQNSMMFTPCWPSAGPTGGAGVADPAFSCSVKVLTSFFFGGMSLPGLECRVWCIDARCATTVCTPDRPVARHGDPPRRSQSGRTFKSIAGRPSAAWRGADPRCWASIRTALRKVPRRRRAGGAIRTRSDLRHLVEVQLDRSLAAEDRHQDLQLLLVGVDLA